MQQFKILRLLTVLIILSLLSLGWSTNTWAALQVSFRSQPSPAELSVGEAGTWSVAVSNPDAQDANNVTLTVTLPDDYTVTESDGGNESAGPPHTLTWTINTISGSGGESVKTFKARPNCSAVDGELMRAEVSPGGALANSDQITVKSPVISVRLTDENGNTVRDAAVGDPVTWTLTVDNSGAGAAVHGTMVTFDLGTALSYDGANPVSSSSGHALPGPPAGQQLVWNTGPVLDGDRAVYEIKTVVTGCDRNGLVNNVKVTWSDDGSGSGTSCVPAATTLSSVALDLNEPDIKISVTNPGPIAYCHGNPTTATITISNSGNGPATGFKLQLSHWPSDWQVTPQTAGVGYDSTTATFSLPDIDPGATFTLDFEVEPDSSCHTTSEAKILFLPNYYNQCGPTGTHYTTPVIGPQTWRIETRDIPTFTIVKTGPATANLGDTGLDYTITVTYSGPDSVLPQTVDVVDNYPDKFTVDDPHGGIDDSATRTVTWSNVVFDSSHKTQSFTVTMNGPVADDHCAAFQSYCDQASLTLHDPTTFVDCRGCPGVINDDRAEACTFIEDTQSAIIENSRITMSSPDPADVCTTLSFETCYEFSQSATQTSWSGVTLDNVMDTGSSHFSNSTVTAIRVDGTDYTSTYPGTLQFPLDLSYLDGTAPPPSDGARICVTYTWEVDNYEGDGFNHSILDVPFGDSGCSSSQAFDVGHDFTVVGSHLILTPVSPDLVKSCQPEVFNIILSEPEDQVLGRVFYDTRIILDPRDNYVFDPNAPIQVANLEDVNNGNNPPVVQVSDNGDGTYTLELGDVRIGNSGLANRGVVNITMRHSCDENKSDDWSVKGQYHNHCENDDATATWRETPVVDSQPLKVLYGSPFLMLSPAVIFAASPYPRTTVHIVNGGPAPLLGACLTINLGTGIEYYSHTPTSGNGAPDSVDASDLHSVKFYYAKIEPGALVKLDLEFRLLSCTGHNITASLKWCDGPACNNPDACGPKVKISTVKLPKSQVVVISHAGGKLDYCNDVQADYSITAGNNDQADAFNLRIIELLPPGITYVPNSVVFTHIGGYGPLTGNPTETIQDVGGRQQVTWDFSTVLPLNGDSPQSPSMAPSSELKADFGVEIVDCDAAKDYRDATNKSAQATVLYDPPCNFTGSDPPKSDSRLLSTVTYIPHLVIDKQGHNLTRGGPWENTLIGADANDEIEWRITYHNDGDYVAREVTVGDILPPGLVGNVYDSTLDGNPLNNNWINGYNIGSIDPGQTRTILFKTQVLQNCQASRGTNTAEVEYGCCSEPPMHQAASDTVDLTISPDFSDAGGQINITHESDGRLGRRWPVCGGTVVIILTNSGGSAHNQKITTTLDSHYEVDPTGNCTIASNDPNHTFTCPTLTAGAGTVEFNSTNIDKVAPDETITIKFDAVVRTDASTGACDVPPGRITNNVSFDFTDSCSITTKTVTDDDSFPPRRPNLTLAVSPVQQLVEEGDQANWQITLTNSGNYRAEDVVLTVDLGNGFNSPGDDRSGSWSGNTATWNIPSINRNGTWVVNVNAMVFDTAAGETPGSLANHIHAISHCGGASGCIVSDLETDAYTTAFSLEKSVDRTDANVGELLTYDVKAVFSNTDTFTGTEIVDTLPGYVNYISATPQADSNFTSAPTVSGSTLTWKPADFQGRKVFHYLIQARIRNDANLSGGQVLTNSIVSRFKVDYGNNQVSPEFSLTRSASTTAHEPKLDISKSITPATVQAGDEVTVTLMVTNNGDGPARNVVVRDLLNDNNALDTANPGVPDGIVDSKDVIVYDCTTITENQTPTGFTYSVGGSAPACEVRYQLGDNLEVASGTSSTFTFKVKIANSVVTGSSNLVNRAGTSGWSLLHPGDSESGNTSYDRETANSATAAVTTENVTNGKSLKITSESDTTGNYLAIGEVATYELDFSFPAGETLNVTLVDLVPDGLDYIPSSAVLDRSNVGITAETNPGNINAGTPGTPVAVSLDQSTAGELKLALGKVTNNSGQIAHMVLTLKCLAANTGSNSSGQTLTNRGRLDWTDASGTDYQTAGGQVDMQIVEPVPGVGKTASPASVEGGDTVTFTITLCNNAAGNFAAPAYDWNFNDPLPAEYENPRVTNVDTGTTGAVVNTAFNGNLLQGTIDKLDPGECVTITYQAEVKAGTAYGSTINNTVSFTTTSLPGEHGTGDATPGTPGDRDGERTGSQAGPNDLYGQDGAAVGVKIPTLDKTIVTPQTWYAIGDNETFEVTVGLPAGSIDNFVLADTLPTGLEYVVGSQSVTTPAGFSSTNDPPVFNWDSATGKLTWDFGTIATANGDLVVTYQVRVRNVIGNQDNTKLENSVVLNYGTGQSLGPVTRTMTVGEPDLFLQKSAVTSPVDLDAGDSFTYRIEFHNNGHTTAYQADWKDVLPDGLYQIASPQLSVTGNTGVYRNGTATLLTTADLVVGDTTNTGDTISLPAFEMAPGSSFTVEFSCTLMNSVMAGETLDNRTHVAYASQVSGDHSNDVRDCETPPCDDDNNTVLNNYGESAGYAFDVKAEIKIDKLLLGGTDKFTIGEDFTYRLVTWVMEGVSPQVEVHDDIPAGLTLQNHQILTPPGGLISFSNPGYNTPNGNVWFDFGNVSNAANQDKTDDHFDVDLTVRVDNIMANQDGVTITNNAFVRWSAGPDESSQDVDITIIEPLLEVIKTVTPTVQARGDLVTYTVTARHASGTTCNAFDLVISDTLPNGLTFISSTESNTGSGQNLEFHKASLLQGEQWQFTYIVRVDATATPGTLENSLKLDWSCLAGADGGTHSGRNGSNCGQTNPLNDYCDTDQVPLLVVAPEVNIQKTVYLGHDSGASCPGGELAVGVNGKTVTYCFTVTNTGDTYLDSFTIADSNLGITETDLTLVSGTTPLAPGQSLVYYFESAINGDLINTAGVSATPTDAGGTPIPGASNVTDTDTAQVDEIAPQIELAKTVYLGHDNGASCPGSELAVGTGGTLITYCFTITNRGDTYLNDITLDDTDLGINITNLTLISGNQPLAPGQSLVYYYESSITGDLTNTASTSGNPTDAGGVDLPEVTDPTATDTAQVRMAHPGISIAKTVYRGHNGGASCPGGELVIGENSAPVTYCFIVTNTGDTYLNDVTIKDAQLGLDVTLTTIPLAPNGTLPYHFETSINGDMTNTAVTSGHPTDAQGNILPGLPDPTASDTASVDQVAPAIDIQKTVYLGHDGGTSCPSAIERVIDKIGSDVTYCFTVTNTGDTYLNNVTIDDADLGISITNLTPVSGSQPLAPAASLTFYYESTITRNLLNTARTSGKPSDSSGTILTGIPEPNAVDTAQVEIVQPGLTLSKTVYPGHDHGASCPGSTHISVGKIVITHPNCPPVTQPVDITYCFTATNTGGTYLDKITIADKQLGITETDMTLISGSLPLAPGASLNLYYETQVVKDVVNTADTCGVAVDEHGNEIPGYPKPCDSATAEVTLDPSIPTLNEWGIILFVLMSSLVSIYFIRRRRYL